MLALLLALSTLTCHDDPLPFEPLGGRFFASVGVDVSTADAPVGTPIAIAIEVASAEPLAALHGRLLFDPARLRYVGQIVTSYLVIVNDHQEAAGRIELISLDVGGLPARSAVLVFETRAPDYLGGLRYIPVEAVSREMAVVGVSAPSAVEEASGLPTTGARRLTLADWAALLYADEDSIGPRGSNRSPGQYALDLRYGDANLNGAITTFDGAVTANAAVGNLEIIGGTDNPVRDFVVAANVRPANLPGLGEPGDALPPGVDANGTRAVTTLDATVISNEAVGNDQAIAGELIPGRGTPPTARALVSGVLGTDRTFSADTVYELQGVVRVDSGATLTVQAGTRIEGQADAGLVIARDGRLLAPGTPLQPIVFTCTGVAKTPGCWGGVVVNGYAPLNEGTATSPPVRGTGAGGCNQVAGGATGSYGGCDEADSSGVLRYVRVEYAGGGAAGDYPGGLACRGVGSATVADYVQVQASGRPGVAFFGGAAGVRHLVLTQNVGDGASWNTGWTGKVQFLVIQQHATETGGGIVGANNDTVFDATPRSAPTLFNTTLVGMASPGGSGTGPALRLRAGSGGTLRNLLVLKYPVGLDVDDSETCAQLSGAGLTLQHALWVGNAAVGADEGDCVTESGYVAGQPTHLVLGPGAVADSQVLDPLSLHLPDWRPRYGTTAATTVGEVPPSDGFFDPAANYLGAVPAENVSGTLIPWYAGWTVGTLTGGAAVGTIQGTVTSPQRGPLVGVRVRAVFGDRSAATDTAGFYTIPGVPAGPATVVLSSLSLGCTDPGPRTTTVPSAGTAVVDFSVTCDTSRPPVPEGFASPDSAEALLVSPPGQPDLLVLRDFLHIRFDDTTSGPGVRAILAKYDAVVAGGYPQTGVYVVRIPDPGPTYEALDSILAAIAAEPGVANAYRRIKRAPIEQLGRYPTDGPEGQREDWFSAGTDATRALRAIRAPLSWGCETGLYDSSQGKVGVGVVDDVFDAAHLDLASSNIAIQPLVGQILSDALGQYGRSHGTGVVGTIGAHGDNGMGTAGLVWGAELHLFEVAREVNGVTRRVEDVAAHLVNVILPAARAAPIRILHSSISAPADPRIAVDLAWQLERFVNAEPLGRLFVQGAGNDRVTFSPADADTLVKGGWLTQQAVVALAGTVAGDRVLLVSAADRDGDAIWVDDIPGRGTTLWTGVSEILAPGEDILALARTVDFPSGTAVVEGTSFAAPLVSGVAALLWAFDPTLSAELVKHYIVEGARQRLRPDGSLVDSPVIPNSGGLNLLDAYEALAKASRERPGTPVCGFPVFARDDAVFQVRAPGDTQTIPVPVPAGTFLANVSVAQGGRLLAVTRLTGGNAVVQFTHTGHAVGVPLPLTRRQFLERDTLDWSLFDSNSDSWLILRRGNGTTDSLNAAALTFPMPTGTRFTAEVEGSPAGDWMAVRTLDAAGGTVTHRWDLLDFVQRVPQPVATIVRSLPLPFNCLDCDGIFVPERIAGWTHDGQLVLLAFPRADRVSGSLVGLRTRVQRVPVVNGVPSLPGPTDVVEQVIAKRPRFTADDAVLIWNELDLSSTCYRATRTASDPAQLLGVAVADIGECDLGDAGPTIFNTPPPAATAGSAGTHPAVRPAHPARR